MRITLPHYRQALIELGNHKASIGRRFKGRFIQVFLALKYYQNELPSIFSGEFVSTDVLQIMLDDLYAKRTEPLNRCVLSLFTNSYLARTGLTSPGHISPQNTWRNNLNLQKGIGCHAPVNDLASPTFLNQDRGDCRYISTSTNPNQARLSGRHCTLCTRQAVYRGEKHRKWLRLNPDGSGYAVVDLYNTENFVDYVAPSGSKIPLYPLIAALYYDAVIRHGRESISLENFMDDFSFTELEMLTYFDWSAENPSNRVLLEIDGDVEGEPIQLAPEIRDVETQYAAPNPTAPGTPVTPPAINSGWDAEMYVAAYLSQQGWTVDNVSRQRIGFDLIARRGVRTKYFEVKSSVGLCNPTLTANEWQMANYHGDDFVLAILENFSPSGQNTIYWIPSPSTCRSRATPTVTFAIPRSQWLEATVLFDTIR